MAKTLKLKLELSYNQDDRRKIHQLEAALEQFYKDIDIGSRFVEPAGGGVRTEILDEIWEVTKTAARRVIDNYEREELYSTIKEDAHRIAETYQGFDWQIIERYARPVSPAELIRRGILSFQRVFIDTIAETDKSAADEIEASIAKIAKEYAVKYAGELEEWADLQAIITNYPREYISPTDKVSQKAFEGVLNKTDLQAIAMERRGSSREINTLASINFDDLGGEVQIKGTELNAYDRVVHDAITTLYIEGGNKIMTPRMIYQAMTGNPDAILTNVSADQISDSLTKLLYSQVVIKADDDIQQYGHKSFTYDGALIAGERITAKVNGQRVNECIHLFREPILYEYANKKNQIGRIPIKLLNSPINNNREIIILKDYLKNRILAMKGGNLSRVIVYSTVFNKIGIEAATQGALRKKESKTRDQIKRILGYWKNENFIAGYKENKKGGLIYSVTVDVNK